MKEMCAACEMAAQVPKCQSTSDSNSLYLEPQQQNVIAYPISLVPPLYSSQGLLLLVFKHKSLGLRPNACQSQLLTFLLTGEGLVVNRIQRKVP